MTRARDTASLALTVVAKAPIASPTFTGTVAGVTAAMIGLGSVNNTTDAAKPVSTAQQTALDLKAPIASPTFTGTVGGVTKAMVGLGSADNTADSAKPISTAAQTALDLKAPLASPTFTGTATFAGVKETVYALAGTAISVANGTVQTKTITANTTFTDSLASGESVVLILTNASSFTITWPTVVWFTALGNIPPTLTALDMIRLAKVGATLYASWGGSAV